MKRLLLLGSCVLVGWLNSARAYAEVVIDQAQPVMDTTVGTLGIGGASQQRLAQTVTAQFGGILRAVYLPIACASGRMTVEIRNVDALGMPGPVVLRQATFSTTATRLPVQLFKRFSVDSMIVNPGDQFAIAVSNATGSCGIAVGPIGDNYFTGDSFFDARPNAPGWVPFAQFPGSRRDLPFQTEVYRW